MNFRRLTAALAISAGVLLAAVGTAGAIPHPPHWTDGTQCQGQFCNPEHPNPPPLAPKWADGQKCKVLLVDPASFVFITVHAKTSGTEIGSVVTPYSASPPHFDPVTVTNLVDGQRGRLTLTWNIGYGVSDALDFDCTSPPSTTTSTTVTTTTVPEATTTTTTQVPMTTVTPTTNPCDQFATGIAPNDMRPGAAECGGVPTLPRTGSSSQLPIAGVSAVALGVPAVVLTRRRVTR